MRTLKNTLLILCCVLFSQSVMAQLTSVHLNMNGSRVHFGVEVEGLGEVIIDAYGNIVRVIHYDDFSRHDIRYEYYSDFRDYEAGKIKSIGDVSFTYYSDFRGYESGKIKSIGGKSVKYYSDFRDYEAGKVQSVGGVSIAYYSDFRDYESGKIKSIGKHKYEYFSDFGGSHNAGLPKSGYAKVTEGGITFLLSRRRR